MYLHKVHYNKADFSTLCKAGDNCYTLQVIFSHHGIPTGKSLSGVSALLLASHTRLLPT